MSNRVLPSSTTTWEDIDTVGKLRAALEDLITIAGEDCKIRWPIVTSLDEDGDGPATQEEVECHVDLVLDDDETDSVLLVAYSTCEDDRAAAVYYGDLEDLGF